MSVPEQHTVTSASGEYSRTAWLVPGPQDRPHPVGVFMDAEIYLGNMNALPVLSELMSSGAIPPMTLVFISHVNATARHADYVCNERYAKFIADDVVGWARARHAAIQAHDNLIAGVSLSGLEAAFIAFHHPQVFSSALCQSGSFWWLKDRDIAWPRTSAKLWLSAGDKETAKGLTHAPSGLRQELTQIEGVELAVRLLEPLGARVKYSLHEGGHATAPWRAELPRALGWLVGRGR